VRATRGDALLRACTKPSPDGRRGDGEPQCPGEPTTLPHHPRRGQSAYMYVFCWLGENTHAYVSSRSIVQTTFTLYLSSPLKKKKKKEQILSHSMHAKLALHSRSHVVIFIVSARLKSLAISWAPLRTPSSVVALSMRGKPMQCKEPSTACSVFESFVRPPLGLAVSSLDPGSPYVSHRALPRVTACNCVEWSRPPVAPRRLAWPQLFHLGLFLRHSRCKTLSQSPRHLITYYLWYFADVAAYLLKKEIEKIRL